MVMGSHQLYAQRPGFFIWRGNSNTVYFTEDIDSITFTDNIPPIFDRYSMYEVALNYFNSMYSRYLTVQGMSGEGCVKIWYGNYPGNDFQCCAKTGWTPLINQTYHERTNSVYNYFLWYYYYSVISNGHKFLYELENSNVATEQDILNYKVPVLVMRAYSYLMLAQLYCKRWTDSNNGASQGLPILSDSCSVDNAFDLEFVSLREVYQEIYKLTDEAIELSLNSLYNSDYNTFPERTVGYYSAHYLRTPGRDAAYATKARAALYRQDWETAAKCASLAKSNYPLMDNQTYMNGGFNDDTSEMIWGLYGDSGLYYSSFFNYIGSNSSAIACRNYPSAISKELIDKIPDTDVRKKMFLIPSASELKECDAFGRSTGSLYQRAFSDYGNKLYSTSNIYAYMQFKFQSQDGTNSGTGWLHIIRSSEMYLTEAEADYYLGKYEEACSLLNQLNKERDPAYNCTKSGEELLEEIRLYRRFELWGEGFDWFDMKRWNLPIVRHSYAQGGSFAEEFAVTIEPHEANQWVWEIPRDYEYVEIQ